MLKYDNKQKPAEYILTRSVAAVRRAIRFESHSLTCMFGTTCNICRLTQTCTIVKQENKNHPSPLAILTEVFLPTSSACLCIAKHSYNKMDFIFDSMRRGCQATIIHRMQRRKWSGEWRRRCLATATHQRSLLWLEAPIGYHSVRLVLRVLPSASHSPTIGFCVESQCIWGKWRKQKYHTEQK